MIQTINVGKQVLSGIGSYPLEGGYIYINPSGMGLYAYKFSRDGNGKPVFTQAGVSDRVFTSKSVPTVTSKPDLELCIGVFIANYAQVTMGHQDLAS